MTELKKMARDEERKGRSSINKMRSTIIIHKAHNGRGSGLKYTRRGFPNVTDQGNGRDGPYLRFKEHVGSQGSHLISGSWCWGWSGVVVGVGFQKALVGGYVVAEDQPRNQASA
jgi:hypothetical protein